MSLKPGLQPKYTEVPEESDTHDEDEASFINPDVHEFRLGRFCANRARVYSAFAHWRVSTAAGLPFF